MKYNNTYIVCDVETGGLPDKLKKKATIEVALTEIAFVAIDCESLEIVEEKSWLIKPYSSDLIYQKEALEVSNISIDLLNKSGQEMKDVFKEIVSFAKKYKKGRHLPKLIGHNIKKFDLQFIEGLFEFNNDDPLKYFHPEVYDTLEWARDKWVESDKFNLQAVSRKLNIEHTQAHRALADTIVTAKVWISFLKSLRDESVKIVDQKKERFRNTFKFEI